MFFTRYTVRGSGAFPFDMLRYDQSFPAGSEDAHNMSGDSLTETRSVTLGRYTKQKVQAEPTYRRWISFGWTVDKSSVECRRSGT